MFKNLKREVEGTQVFSLGWVAAGLFLGEGSKYEPSVQGERR
jgi:hypothetical protein